MRQSIRWILEKTDVNYLYFSLLLIFIGTLVIFPLLWAQAPLFFVFYALGQTAAEVGVFVLLSHLVKRLAPPLVHFFFTSLCFGCVGVHLIDFMMARLLDTSIDYPVKFIFGFGAAHVWTALAACNMNLSMLSIILGSVLAIPSFGALLYRLTQKHTVRLSLFQISFFLTSLTLSLFFLDHISPVSRSSYEKYQKMLPFGATLLAPPKQYIPLKGSIAPPRDEHSLNLPLFSLPSKPNLYFFIVETLRKDFVHRETAPHLSSFARENIEIPLSFANANTTRLSWFAIFHSDFPYHWVKMQNQWHTGSIPLQILKKNGYKIRVYSSADLRFFGMDELIFGKDLSLADTIEAYSHADFPDASDRDILAFQSFERDLHTEEAKEGNCFIFFLDSTHSEYSFPKDFPLKFQPIAQQIDYLTLTKTDLEPIKNRYRNSIAFIDSLMGNFFDLLKRKNLYDTSIIAITGDHGEEFFEENALFHGTHLNNFQTSVPILLKFANNPWAVQTQTATHIDLFPSILHYLGKLDDWKMFMDGESIFLDNRWPYRIAVGQTGARSPFEVTLTKEDCEISARLESGDALYRQTQLEILSIKNPTPIAEDQVSHLFAPLLKKEETD